MKICIRCKNEKLDGEMCKERNLCSECQREYCRNYKKTHREAVSAYNKQYKKIHKSTISLYNKEYNIANRETIQKRHTRYLREKRKNDPNYKISLAYRNRVKKIVKGQLNTSSISLLGCNVPTFMEWIESQFVEGMTFENHGSVWHLDHVIPCSKFDNCIETERLRCFNWSNIQPLFGAINLKKKNRVYIEEILTHEFKVQQYILQNEMDSTNTIIDFCILEYLV